MTNVCPICLTPELVASAASLHQLGANHEEIANAFSFSVSDVERHFSKCPDAAAADSPLTDSDEALHILLRDSLENYRLALDGRHRRRTGTARRRLLFRV